MKNTIKNAGFTTKRYNAMPFKGLFGGTCNHVIALQNSKGETLHFEGKPYFPYGKQKAYAALIESGDIYSECFTFKMLEASF